MSNSAVEVRNVSKMFRLYHEKNQYLKTALLRGRRARYEDFWALKDVSFDIPHGSTFGIIGSNGSGKSTLLKCLAGILTPDKGSITVNGRIAALLELGAGFHPELSGRENVFLNGAILGMTRSELETKFDEIVEFAGLEEFIDTPVKNYSSGMTVRLGFAIAINVDPEILIIDEVLAVGDAAFQLKCYEKIEEFRKQGKTIIIVSHGLGELAQICDSIACLSGGKLIDFGTANGVVDRYLHTTRSQVTRDHTISDDRWGSGEARISKMELLDGDAVPQSGFETSGAMYIRVHLESDEPMPGLSVQIRISHMHGEEVWKSSTVRMGFEIPQFEDGFSFQLNIPNLNILEGTYDVTPTLTDHSEIHVFDQWKNGLRFDVHQQHHVEQGLVGLLNLGTNWSLLD